MKPQEEAKTPFERRIKMNGTMNRTMKEMMTPMMNSTMKTVRADSPACEGAEPALVAENCKASSFSLAAFAGGFLMTLGIILYAILTV